MKTTAIARIRQIRQSLFAQFAGVQSSVDHAPVSERKSLAVRQLYRILNNDSHVWIPTQVVADCSTGVFARLRRGVSRRVSALTIRNPFSEESLERTKRAFAFAFIETSLEKRQLLATFSYSESGVGTGLLTVTSDTADEQLSFTSFSGDGNYTLTTTSNFNGPTVTGITGNTTNRLVVDLTAIANFTTLQILDGNSNTSLGFGTANGDIGVNFNVTFSNATAGTISVANATSIINGYDISLSTASNSITVSSPLSANSTSDVSLTGRNIVVTGNISTAAGGISLIGNNRTNQTGEFNGVRISGSTVNVNTTSGSIVIDGRGGATTINAGVNLQSSKVQAGGSGTVTITGVSGDGGTNYAYGVVASGATVTTSSGSLTVNGTSSGRGTNSRGVYLSSSANISATDSGHVTITGKAANGTDYAIGIFVRASKVTTTSGSLTVNGTSCGTGTYSKGVFLRSSTNISATGTGHVTITGTAANGTVEARGIEVFGNSCITTTSGSLTFNGTSCGTGTYSRGVYLISSANISATGTGHVTITGTAANGTDTARGIDINGSTVTTTSGSLTVNGTSCGTGTNSRGVYLFTNANISATGAGHVTITGSTSLNFSHFTAIAFIDAGSKVYTNGGLITLNAKSLNLTGTVNATSAGNVLIQPFGAGVDLNRDHAENWSLCFRNNLLHCIAYGV